LPILKALKSLDVNAEFSGRNDLTIEGKKFSGNAEHVFKNRVLHHGTLLFSSEMADLSNALKVDPSKFSDKAVKSVRARVTNISEHLQQKLDVLEFRDIIMKYVMSTTENSRVYSFTQEDIDAISKLRDEKYSTYEWNYGHSPKYNFSKKIKTAGGHIEVALFVENGIISKAKIYGDYFHILDPLDIEKALVGTTHDEQAIRQRLSDLSLKEYFVNITLDELIEGMF
jgi:lipoate-protein ligase A